MFQATLVGNLGQDPAEKDINGTKFVEASIAVKCGKDHTEWVNLSLYGKQGEIFKQYMSKGKQVAVTGSISFYLNKEGKKYTQMRVSDFTMLGGSIQSKPSGWQEGLS